MYSSFTEQQQMRSPEYWLNHFNGQDDGDKDKTEQPLMLLTGDDIAREEGQGRDAKMLIEGLLPARGFHPLIGDSGLGKSPLLMQAAVCVATGTPFLGHNVRQGKVLINDHENAGHLDRTLRAVSRAIGKDYDRDVKAHLAFLPSAEAADVFKVFAAGHKFALVLVDALRGFCGGGESDSKVIQPLITKMSAIDTCWLVCHHLRKEDRKQPPPPLEDLNTKVVSWLQEAAGARGIINQASTRLAVIEPKDVEAALFVRGFVKGHGEVGPFHLERVYDPADVETPLGYKLASDWRLLKETQRMQFRQVAGKTLCYGDLKALLGDKPTRTFLAAARPLGLFHETGRKGQPDRRYVFKAYDANTENYTTCMDGACENLFSGTPPVPGTGGRPMTTEGPQVD
jgi:hypothetical protein